MIGSLFDDRYGVVSRLGGSEIADVYLADDLVLGRQVALKVLAPHFAHDEQLLERFRSAAGRAAGLEHSNIVHMTHLLEAEDGYYVVMEYLTGRPLQAIILEHAPLSADLLASVSLQILEALRFAHRRNVVHGDVRAQNVIVADDGGVKVTDFGLARAVHGPAVEAAEDLHALGELMYQMATGRLPFERDEAASISEEHVQDQPPTPRTLNPLIPEGLEAIVMRSLGLSPVDPYLTAQAFLDDMRGLEDSQPVAASNGFAEEAARVMASSAGPMGADPAGAAWPDPVSRRPEQQAPIIEPEERPGRPRHAWPWVLVTILILALSATYLIYSSRSTTAAPQFGTVPEVVGLAEAKAISKIQAAGFGYRIEGRQPSVDFEEGAVALQDTAAGIKLEKGGVIGIWLSSGSGQVKVPNVVGLAQAVAAESLSGAGLEPVVKPEVDVDAEVGLVVRQNPEADKKVDAGAKVTITVAAATNTVEVPPLTGMTQENAVALLQGMKLVPDVQETDSALPGGIVDHQDPASPSEVRPGATVKVFVSNAPQAKTVLVPAVGALGLTEAQAKAILARYRLKPRVVDLETPDSRPGLCIYQDPVAGVEVKIDSVVNITIARKPQTTTTTAPSAGATRYDQTESYIVKTGQWANFSTAGAYLGSYGRSSTSGASATIYFTGIRLDWIAMKGTTTGVAEVYLDGVKKAIINLAAPAAAYDVNVWSTGVLAPGSHRVTLVLSPSSPAGKYLTLDAVDIWGTIRSRP